MKFVYKVEMQSDVAPTLWLNSGNAGGVFTSAAKAKRQLEKAGASNVNYRIVKVPSKPQVVATFPAGTFPKS